VTSEPEGPPVSEAATTETTASSATLEVLAAAIGGGDLTTVRFRDNLRVYLALDQLIPALATLRDQAGFRLLEIGCVDYLGYPKRDPSKPRFEVHYALLNPDSHERLILKVGVDDPEPSIPTAVPLWAGADWMEREIYDMFGIRFDGHPNLRRILMPEEFAAHPLRKDYPLRGRGERHNFPRLTRDES
jgi:NADH-quinone oxidoreductase subunit C